MTNTYIEVTNELGGKSILKTDENGNQWSIPLDPANSDYQAYLNPDKVEHLTSPLTDPAA